MSTINLEEAVRAIEVARAKEPRLRNGGFSDTPDKPEHEMRSAEVATAIAFLCRCRPTKTTSLSSYGLKHAAERWGEANGAEPYVSNGALIAAALYLGLRVKLYNASLNAMIEVNRVDVQELDPECIWTSGYILKRLSSSPRRYSL